MEHTQNFAVNYFAKCPKDFDDLMDLAKSQRIVNIYRDKGATDSKEYQLAKKQVAKLTSTYEKIKANYEEWLLNVAPK
jgi:hypothetical protein